MSEGDELRAPAWVRAVDGLAVVCAILASVMLTVAAGVITVMVIDRAIGASAYWQIEFSVYLMVAAVFLGSPYTLHTRGHVNVDLLDTILPPAFRKGVRFAVGLVGLAVCIYLAWVGWTLFHAAWESGDTSESMWAAPLWPLYLTMPVGLGLTALQYLAELWRIR